MNRAESITRRRFAGAALGAAGCLAGPLIIPAAALGRGGTAPGQRVTVGLIGCGGRGVHECSSYIPFDNCEIVAVCDPLEDRRTRAKQVFEKLYSEHRPVYKGGIQTYLRFRQ